MSAWGGQKAFVLEDPPIARALLDDTRFAWLWLPFRLYLGYAWFSSGWNKLDNPAWMGTSEALKRYWENAVRVDPRPVIAVDWYRAFIQFLLDADAYTWFAKLIFWGELFSARACSATPRAPTAMLRASVTRSRVSRSCAA